MVNNRTMRSDADADSTQLLGSGNSLRALYLAVNDEFDLSHGCHLAADAQPCCHCVRARFCFLQLLARMFTVDFQQQQGTAGDKTLSLGSAP